MFLYIVCAIYTASRLAQGLYSRAKQVVHDYPFVFACAAALVTLTVTSIIIALNVDAGLGLYSWDPVLSDLDLLYDIETTGPGVCLFIISQVRQ